MRHSTFEHLTAHLQKHRQTLTCPVSGSWTGLGADYADGAVGPHPLSVPTTEHLLGKDRLLPVAV